MKIFVLAASAAALAAASPGLAAPSIGRAAEPGYLLFDHGSANAIAGAPQNLKNALVLLRSEAVSMQTKDGGTLTAVHRSYLQTKLDRLTGRRLGTLRDL